MKNSIKKANNKTYVVSDEDGSIQPLIRVSFLEECYDSYSRHSDSPNRVRCEILCSLNFEKFKTVLGEDGVIPFNVIPLMKKWEIEEDGKFVVVAYAKKNDLDEWNETTGYRIAQTRAKAKAYFKASRITKDIIKQLNDYIACCENNIMYCDYMKEDEDSHIEDLISNTYND